jgi:hypothetical protein
LKRVTFVPKYPEIEFHMSEGQLEVFELPNTFGEATAG